MEKRKGLKRAPFVECYCPMAGCKFYFRTAAERDGHYASKPGHNPATQAALIDDLNLHLSMSAESASASLASTAEVPGTAELKEEEQLVNAETPVKAAPDPR